MKLILLGPPGVGKGTQAEAIVGKYGIVHISTGDIFRKNLKENTPLGLKAKEYMDKGLLVPDDVTVAMLKDRLSAPDCAAGYMLDGFPRTIEQAKALDTALAEAGDSIDCALALIANYDLLIERIIGRRICRECGTAYHISFSPPKKEGVCDKCAGELYQRTDDTQDTVMTRLKEYEEKTQPLIDYYTAQDILKSVDGTHSREKVSADVEAILDDFA